MAKTGYEQVTVEEIRAKLRDEHEITDEDFLKSTKGVLVQRLLELENAVDVPDDVDEVFQEAEEEMSDEVFVPHDEEAVAQTMPGFGSENWHEYVMRQFADDELMDGAPTCDGCRRVVEDLIGPIIESTLPHISAPNTMNNGTSTISVKISVLVTNDLHPAKGYTITCEEIADVNRDNTDHPYHKYSSATAATRAEGRALRKLLRLKNVHTAEEVSERAETTDTSCDWSVDTPISDTQIRCIDMLCKRLDVDAMSFINSGRNHYDSIYSVKTSTASSMIQELNNFQQKVKAIPEGLGSYEPGWEANQQKGE